MKIVHTNSGLPKKKRVSFTESFHTLHKHLGQDPFCKKLPAYSLCNLIQLSQFSRYKCLQWGICPCRWVCTFSIKQSDKYEWVSSPPGKLITMWLSKQGPVLTTVSLPSLFPSLQDQWGYVPPKTPMSTRNTRQSKATEHDREDTQRMPFVIPELFHYWTIVPTVKTSHSCVSHVFIEYDYDGFSKTRMEKCNCKISLLEYRTTVISTSSFSLRHFFQNLLEDAPYICHTLWYYPTSLSIRLKNKYINT